MKKMYPLSALMLLIMLVISSCKKNDVSSNEEMKTSVKAVKKDGKLLIEYNDGKSVQYLNSLDISDKYKLEPYINENGKVVLKFGSVNKKIAKNTVSTVLFWEVTPSNSINDGTAVGSCNGAYDNTLIKLIQEENELVLHTYFVKGQMYLEIIGDSYLIEQGQDEETDDYLQCFYDNDPVNVVRIVNH